MKYGEITLNWGSMYSGKTEELQRQMKRAKYGGKKYKLFKPSLDTRDKHVATHNGEKLSAITVNAPAKILYHVDNCEEKIEVVGIDEGQFFDESLVEVCKELKRRGIDVFISGLDIDFNGDPFETTMKLAAIANKTNKFQAVCVSCGEDAYISHRTIKNEEKVLVGSKGMYIALCETCFSKKKNGDSQKPIPKPGEVYQSYTGEMVTVLSIADNETDYYKGKKDVVFENEEGELSSLLVEDFLEMILIDGAYMERYTQISGITWERS